MIDSFDIAYNLHDEIVKSKQYINLKEKEKIMLENKECLDLIASYNDLLLISRNDNQKETKEKLFQAKLALDNNLLVKDYKLARKELKILVGEISEVVFKDLDVRLGIESIIKELK